MNKMKKINEIIEKIGAKSHTHIQNNQEVPRESQFNPKVE